MFVTCRAEELMKELDQEKLRIRKYRFYLCSRLGSLTVAAAVIGTVVAVYWSRTRSL